MTVPDPLAHLIDRLHDAGASSLPSARALLRELGAVQAMVQRHNHKGELPAGMIIDKPRSRLVITSN